MRGKGEMGAVGGIHQQQRPIGVSYVRNALHIRTKPVIVGAGEQHRIRRLGLQGLLHLSWRQHARQPFRGIHLR